MLGRFVVQDFKPSLKFKWVRIQTSLDPAHLYSQTWTHLQSLPNVDVFLKDCKVIKIIKGFYVK